MNKIVAWLDKTWSRILLASVACGFGLLFALGFLMNGFEQKVYDYRRLELQRMTEVALNTVQPIVESHNSGRLTKEQALDEIRALVRRMVFHDLFGYNYVFMSSYDGIMLIQPFEPSLEGTDQIALKDAYGLPIIQELITRAKGGGGYVTYYYHPPERAEPQQKISYVAGIPELSVYIGSGMYMEDIRASYRQFVNSLLLVCSVIFGVIITAQYAIMSPMFNSYRVLTDAFARLNRRFNVKERVAVTGYRKSSEAEKLLTGFNLLLADIETKTEALRQSEMKFRTLYEYANDAIFIIRNGIIVDCNERTQVLFAMPREKIIGSMPEMFSPVYQPDGHTSKEKVRMLISAVNSGRPLLFEWKHSRGENEFDAEVSLGRFDIEGDSYLLAIIRDISERKEAEKRLQEINDELVASYSQLAENNAQLKNREEEIWYLAYHDTLTGLPNRRSITEQLDAELDKAVRGESSGALLFIDLDNFKVINDSCGHVAGDEVLVAVAQDMSDIFSPSHIVSRFGGDEFVVLLRDVNCAQTIEDYAESILQTMHKQIDICGHRFLLSTSIGIVSYPQDGTTVDELLKKADTALYAVKNSGKSAWQYYSPAMQKIIVERLSLEQSLREGLDKNEFTLQFQPIIDTNRSRIDGFEALIRWRNPKHGSVSPLTFIPLAEESGLIIPIGRWVLQSACQFAKRLVDLGYKDIIVAVNISVKQLAQADFVPMVQMILAEAGLQAPNLELEITETVLMDDVDSNVEKLLELRKLGVKLALDDFGTGYSSLTYLTKLPIHVLKIDKSFVDELTVGTQTGGIIGTIIQLSQQLGLKVVAEGVETEEQRAQLLERRCDMIQGYLISTPLSEANAVAFLQSCSCSSDG